jgi:xanthine dehydrogenase accessory factor
MRDLLPQIEQWRHDGKQVALATVVQVYGSALRPAGSKMAISAAGDIAGSVSGGCVEGDVFKQAHKVIKRGRPRLVEYGVSDESAWDIGLACGGKIQIWIELLERDSLLPIKQSLEAGIPMALATVLAEEGQGKHMFIWQGGRTEGDLGDAELKRQVALQGASRLAQQTPGRIQFFAGGRQIDVFIDVFLPRPRLIVVGAVHIAIPLVAYAKTLGLRTIVVDPRSAFATRERFPHADELIVEWPFEAIGNLHPDEASYIVVLTHDDKLDLPALQAALASPARYVGILGSRKTHAKRVQELLRLGISSEQLRRIHAPVGLAIGAVGPEEIALSILAEVVAVRRGMGFRQAISMRVPGSIPIEQIEALEE